MPRFVDRRSSFFDHSSLFCPHPHANPTRLALRIIMMTLIRARGNRDIDAMIFWTCVPWPSEALGYNAAKGTGFKFVPELRRRQVRVSHSSQSKSLSRYHIIFANCEKWHHFSKPVALVIGASRGIGRQIAIDLAKEGYAGEAASQSHPIPCLTHTYLQIQLYISSKTIKLTKIYTHSRRLRKNHLRRLQNRPLFPGPKLAATTINTVARESRNQAETPSPCRPTHKITTQSPISSRRLSRPTAA